MLVRREPGRDRLTGNAPRLAVPGWQSYAAPIRNLIDHLIHTDLDVQSHPAVPVYEVPSTAVPLVTDIEARAIHPLHVAIRGHPDHNACTVQRILRRPDARSIRCT